ncbi:hypothetical protein F5Y11DRAFT_344861 [Daldinia sp. FL1419]|nr:hypothetical protein F5Y11DRAFT_344861 [Daldinia sp. FL1419]
MQILALYVAPPDLSGDPGSGAKHRRYSEDDMASAERVVLHESLSLRQASKLFNVPRTTLAKQLGDKRSKPSPYKTDEVNILRTRRKCAETDMKSTIEAVQNREKAIKVAKRLGVPYSHLNARVCDREPKDLRNERCQLTPKQEDLLAGLAAIRSELGCPATKNEIFTIAELVLRNQGDGKNLGNKWIANWMKKYADVEVLGWEPKKPSPERG